MRSVAKNERFSSVNCDSALLRIVLIRSGGVAQACFIFCQGSLTSSSPELTARTTLVDSLP